MGADAGRGRLNRAPVVGAPAAAAQPPARHAASQSGPRIVRRADAHADRGRDSRTATRARDRRVRSRRSRPPRSTIRLGDRHPARDSTASRSTTARSSCAVPRRHRPGDLPDAARPLPDRRQVEEPVVVPADAGRVGEGPEARPAGPGQPARHALDGPDVARRRHPRHRRARVDRLLASRTAASACTSPTPSGCSTTCESGRRCSSSRPRASVSRPAEARRSGARPGGGRDPRSLLVWRLTHQTHAAEDRRARAAFSLHRADGRRRPYARGRSAGRPSCSTSSPPWCVPCKREAPRARAAVEAGSERSFRASWGSTRVPDAAGDGRRSRASSRHHLSRCLRPERRDRLRTGTTCRACRSRTC